MDVEKRQVVYYERFNGVDYPLQQGRLWNLYRAWKPVVVLAEENSIGKPIIQQLQREGMNVLGFMTTPSSKPPLIESLVLAFDRGEIISLNDEYMKNELKAYEKVVSKTTGRSSYSAPSGLHDDVVIAMALSWYECVNMSVEFRAFF
jgi:hypothetical protein